MKTKLQSQLKSLSDNVRYAQRTVSTYYKIGSIIVRVSDHMSSSSKCDLMIFCNTVQKHSTYVAIPMIGTNKQVQWFTNVDDVIEFTIDFEKFARIFVGSPESSDNVKERIEENKKNEVVIDQISYNDWITKLNTFYNCKKVDFTFLLDEIYRLNGTSARLKSLIGISGLTAKPKYEQVKIMYENIKNCK